MRYAFHLCMVTPQSAAVRLNVDSEDLIASVKARYQAKTSVGRFDYIVLLYKGKELQDDRTLSECGVVPNAVLMHIEAAHEPFRGINYRRLSEQLSTRRAHESKNLKMLRNENIWAPGASMSTIDT